MTPSSKTSRPAYFKTCFRTNTIWMQSLAHTIRRAQRSSTSFQVLVLYFFCQIISKPRKRNTKCDFVVVFEDKFYVEYESQNKCVKRNSTKNLTSRLVSVIQNHEDTDSVYLVDSNRFVYYLNLKNDYLESIDRQTATYKLFSGCFHNN